MGKKITTANQLSVARKVGNEKGKDGLMWDRILRWESNKLSHWESKFSRLDYFSFRSMDDLFFFDFSFFLFFLVFLFYSSTTIVMMLIAKTPLDPEVAKMVISTCSLKENVWWKELQP